MPLRNNTLNFQVVLANADKEIQWFMNPDFRMALSRNWQTDQPWKVIDFTRYDLTANEPADPQPGKTSRNWSLMNVLNQKGTRPQDQPIAVEALPAEAKNLIRKHYPDLLTAP